MKTQKTPLFQGIGETALAESWQSRDYLSHNHCMLGHLYSWLFSGIGGISQETTQIGRASCRERV